jgi:hypothetical protein
MVMESDGQERSNLALYVGRIALQGVRKLPSALSLGKVAERPNESRGGPWWRPLHDRTHTRPPSSRGCKSFERRVTVVTLHASFQDSVLCDGRNRGDHRPRRVNTKPGEPQ